jgi:murein L,D-transpeptidase YafK
MLTRSTLIALLIGVVVGSAGMWLIIRLTGTSPDPARPTEGPPVDAKTVKLPKLTAPRIVVEKSLHRLTVYDGETPAKTYRCAVGSGTGDKVREGDARTPEGEFYICVKNPNSKYHLSLGLSYPNAEDAVRGLRAGLITKNQHDEILRRINMKGVPPWDTPLGGEIMIHGHGSGRDWTLGCLAMDDDDVEELYHAVDVGTPVTIKP